jgi:hypothetical protein
MNHSLAASLTSLCFMSGVILHMSWFRRISNHLVTLGLIWRSAFSLATLRDIRHGSSTVQRARRCLFQKELTLMNAFS